MRERCTDFTDAESVFGLLQASAPPPWTTYTVPEVDLTISGINHKPGVSTQSPPGRNTPRQNNSTNGEAIVPLNKNLDTDYINLLASQLRSFHSNAERLFSFLPSISNDDLHSGHTWSAWWQSNRPYYTNWTSCHRFSSPAHWLYRPYSSRDQQCPWCNISDWNWSLKSSSRGDRCPETYLTYINSQSISSALAQQCNRCLKLDRRLL